MNLKISFSWAGLVVFALPMLINLAYAAFPPAGKAEPPTPVTRWVELVEQGSRIAYLLAVMLLVSREPVRPQGVWFWLAVCFLALYYAVWIRYFLGGREIALLQRAFLLVPLPLVVFPVLYYLCAALWLRNLPAVILMLIFGAAHLTVSIQSFSAPAAYNVRYASSDVYRIIYFKKGHGPWRRRTSLQKKKWWQPRCRSSGRRGSRG